jgi:myo-inositol 2-dehydrogenase / D-chiro-inositol 1-dehydrogenase
MPVARERYMPVYRTECAAPIANMTEGAAIPESLADGVAAHAMAEAAAISMRSGQPTRLADLR